MPYQLTHCVGTLTRGYFDLKINPSHPMQTFHMNQGRVKYSTWANSFEITRMQLDTWFACLSISIRNWADERIRMNWLVSLLKISNRLSQLDNWTWNTVTRLQLRWRKLPTHLDFVKKAAISAIIMCVWYLEHKYWHAQIYEDFGKTTNWLTIGCIHLFCKLFLFSTLKYRFYWDLRWI